MAIASAQQGRPAQVNPLLIASGQANGATGLAFDVAILPWGEGATVLLLARDITLERSLRAALIESRQRYKDLVEAASDFAWETDAEGRFTFISSGGALGYQHAVSEALLSVDELCDVVRHVTARSQLPIIGDAGVGFGDPVHVTRAVRQFIAAGAAAIAGSTLAGGGSGGDWGGCGGSAGAAGAGSGAGAAAAAFLATFLVAFLATFLATFLLAAFFLVFFLLAAAP